MRKILKLLSLVIFSFCVLMLLGCANSRVTYKDPETGEEKEINIEKTDSDQEVTDSLYAIALSETPLKTSSKDTTTINFEIDLKVRDNKNEEFKNVDLEGKLVIARDVNFSADFNTNKDLLMMINGSGKLEIKGKIPTSSGTESISKSTIEVYLEDGILYLKSDLDSKLIDFLNEEYEEDGVALDVINKKIYKYDPMNSLGLMVFSDEEKETIKSLLEEQNNSSLRAILENRNIELKDIRAELEDAVRLYNIKITRVSGSDVTYSFNLSSLFAKKGMTLDAQITVDVSEMALSSAKIVISFDDENIKGDASFDIDINYKANIGKLSDSEKEEALEYEAATGD